jgi:ABC-type multidrug transport system fused ATPase/permease subunit
MKTIRQIFDFLSHAEKRSFFLLFILIFISSLIDILGVASVLPFIAVLTNPQIVETNIFINFFYRSTAVIGVTNSNQFLFFLGILFLFLIIMSLIFRTITQYAEIRFALMRDYSISKKLLEGYLSQTYTLFLKRYSADISKSIFIEVNKVILGAILPSLIIISQGLLILLIFILLFITDPILALNVSLVLSLSYVFIFYLIKKKILRLNHETFKLNQNRFLAVNEAFSAFKEIKILGLEKIFLDRFTNSAKIYANNEATSRIFASLPRFFIEAICFGGMILLILIMMARGDNFVKIMPIIGLYAFAGYRLIPSIQQVYHSLIQINFSKPNLDNLHKGFINLKFKNSSQEVVKMHVKKFITAKNICFKYFGNKHQTLKNVNLTIPAFSKVAIVGATGSGKTTLVDIILGLLDSFEGTLRVDGKIINNNNKRSWQKCIGYVPQQIYLSDDSISANIAFGADVKEIDHHAVEKAAKIAQIHNFVMTELKNNYETTLGENGVRLSGGQRQRIGIARALYLKPKVLILDEATNALDNLTEKNLIEAIFNLSDKTTLILITHRLNITKNFDKIFFLKKGKLHGSGTFNKLYETNNEFRKMAGLIK